MLLMEDIMFSQRIIAFYLVEIKPNIDDLVLLLWQVVGVFAELNCSSYCAILGPSQLDIFILSYRITHFQGYMH